MNFISRTRLAVLALAAVSPLYSGAAFAQEVSDAHLAASRAAVAAIRATDTFDGILPQAADALKSEMIQRNPDLEQLIVEIVDAESIKMASRRGDLEKEAALAYAKIFSEQELKDITTFYSSPSGIKLLSDGPIATREVYNAADIWQKGIARDLAEAVGKALGERAPKPEPAAK